MPPSASKIGKEQLIKKYISYTFIYNQLRQKSGMVNDMVELFFCFVFTCRSFSENTIQKKKSTLLLTCICIV